MRFIDFHNDGYTRTNRKKAAINLRDTDNAQQRYQEVVDLIHYGSSKHRLLEPHEYYEGTIDPDNGADWNQTRPLTDADLIPTEEDFRKLSVNSYLLKRP